LRITLRAGAPKSGLLNRIISFSFFLFPFLFFLLTGESIPGLANLVARKSSAMPP